MGDLAEPLYAILPGIAYLLIIRHIFSQDWDAGTTTIAGAILGLFIHQVLSSIKDLFEQHLFDSANFEISKYRQKVLELWSENKHSLQWHFGQRAALWGDFAVGGIIVFIIALSKGQLQLSLWLLLTTCVSFFFYINNKCKEIDVVKKYAESVPNKMVPK